MTNKVAKTNNNRGENVSKFFLGASTQHEFTLKNKTYTHKRERERKKKKKHNGRTKIFQARGRSHYWPRQEKKKMETE